MQTDSTRTNVLTLSLFVLCLFVETEKVNHIFALFYLLCLENDVMITPLRRLLSLTFVLFCFFCLILKQVSLFHFDLFVPADGVSFSSARMQ